MFSKAVWRLARGAVGAIVLPGAGRCYPVKRHVGHRRDKRRHHEYESSLRTHQRFSTIRIMACSVPKRARLSTKGSFPHLPAENEPIGVRSGRNATTGVAL